MNEITPQALYDKIHHSREDLQLIDVREADEYKYGHIENAINMPLASIAEQIDQSDKNKEIIVHCKSGVRSAVALLKLKALGFDKVWNLKGGLNSWTKESHPLVHKFYA